MSGCAGWRSRNWSSCLEDMGLDEQSIDPSSTHVVRAPISSTALQATLPPLSISRVAPCSNEMTGRRYGVACCARAIHGPLSISGQSLNPLSPSRDRHMLPFRKIASDQVEVVKYDHGFSRYVISSTSVKASHLIRSRGRRLACSVVPYELPPRPRSGLGQIAPSSPPFEPGS